MSEHANSSFSTTTATGRGAIATICCHGANVQETVASLFRPFGKRHREGVACHRLLKQRNGTIVYGNWIIDGIRGEDLVVLPKSNKCIEIHCHGGSAAVDVISNSLIESGLEQIDNRMMSRRLTNCRWLGDINWAIGQASTQRTATMLLRQRELIPEFIDDTASLLKTNNSQQALAGIESVLKFENFGLHLLRPWTVVLCGRPNVGKSSLINSICGFDRAIVHSTPGTTRDIVTQMTAVEGWPIEIADTAGIRTDSGEIESQGIELAKERIGNADLVIVVLDAAQPRSSEDDLLVAETNPKMVVLNKSDIAIDDKPIDALRVSAVTGDGISTLCSQIADNLVPCPPSQSQAIFFHTEHFAFLHRAAHLLRQNKTEKALETVLGESLVSNE